MLRIISTSLALERDARKNVLLTGVDADTRARVVLGSFAPGTQIDLDNHAERQTLATLLGYRLVRAPQRKRNATARTYRRIKRDLVRLWLARLLLRVVIGIVGLIALHDFWSRWLENFLAMRR